MQRLEKRQAGKRRRRLLEGGLRGGRGIREAVCEGRGREHVYTPHKRRARKTNNR